MKRILVSLLGLVVIAAIAGAGWMLFRGIAPEPETNTAEAGAIAAVDETRTETTEESLDVVAEPVSRLAYGMGGGGGGGGMYMGPFGGATVDLVATLPTIETAPLYEMLSLGMGRVDVDALQAFAATMGVNGEVYFDWYAGMPTDGSTSADGVGPTSYRILDGQKRISAYNSGEFIYEDMANANYYGMRPLTFAESSGIAERFASERGLLDFPYVLHQGWGYEVQFLELVDGRPVTFPRITMTITGDGQVAYLAFRQQIASGALETANLRSAQAAWEYVQAHLEDGQFFYNLIATNPVYYAPATNISQKTNWQREFGSDATISMVTWVSVMRPADGTGSPLIFTDRNYRVTGSDQMLEDIAQATLSNSNLRLIGTVSGQPGSGTISIVDWAPITGPSDLYLGGTTRQEGGQVYLEVAGGYRFPLENAPADLPVDESVTVYSWGIRADAAGMPVLDWTNIDLWNVPYIEDQAYAEADPYNGISEVTIDQVSLGYQALHPGEMLPGMTTMFVEGDSPQLVPVWIFAGRTNKGDIVEIFIPAPDSIELN